MKKNEVQAHGRYILVLSPGAAIAMVWVFSPKTQVELTAFAHRVGDSMTKDFDKEKFELIDQMSLIGPEDRIRHNLDAWRDSFVTTILIAGDVGLLRTAAELVLG